MFKYFFLVTTLIFSVKTLYSQVGIGGEVGYVLAPEKEAFSGRIYLGEYLDAFRIGLGFEKGKFNSKPTGRLLPYYAFKAGVDFHPLNSIDLKMYIGVDFEYLKTTRIIDDNRISIFPKVGARLFNIGFVELSADNLNEPGDEKRIFDLKMNALRLTLGFNVYSEW